MARTDRRKVIVGAACLMTPGLALAAAPRVTIETSLGRVVLEIYPDKAPITAGNFLSYVDRDLFKGASFYRVVRPDNDNNPAVITVIQGGLNLPDGAAPPLAPIAHEPTATTGLKHVSGAISMARDAPGTASSEFFICIGDDPALDQGGARNPDGQGFAAFGRVVEGMDVVQRINALQDTLKSDDPYFKGQILAKPVVITAVSRTP